jgi:B9 domain-containing protein 1
MAFIMFSQGLEHGISQIAKRTSGSSNNILSWNYPIEICFRSTNAYGWPQLVLGVYGLTMTGKDVVKGYGCVHIPCKPGRHVRYVSLYRPIASSIVKRFIHFITNRPPEFFDSKFIAQGMGREVTRVESGGVVKVIFNVTTKNMAEWGYSTDSSIPIPITGSLVSTGSGVTNTENNQNQNHNQNLPSLSHRQSRSNSNLNPNKNQSAPLPQPQQSPQQFLNPVAERINAQNQSRASTLGQDPKRVQFETDSKYGEPSPTQRNLGPSFSLQSQ